MKAWIKSNWKSILKKKLYPHGALIIFLIILSTVSLIYSLAFKDANQIVAYVTYFVSAYTLTVAVIRTPPIIKKIKVMLYANRYSNMYLTDKELRVRISLYGGFAVNNIYAVYNFCSGLFFGSVWLVAIGVYYIILSVMRLGLVRKDRHRAEYNRKAEERLDGIISYIKCGKLMFLLNVAVTGFVVQMIWQNKSYSYPGFLIYASAAYAFFCLTTAIINMAKYRSLEKPVLSAAKMLSFSCALISLLSMQTAMLTQFGERKAFFARLMNGLTGGTVCFLIFGMAVYMVRRGKKEIKKMES